MHVKSLSIVVLLASLGLVVSSTATASVSDAASARTPAGAPVALKPAPAATHHRLSAVRGVPQGAPRAALQAQPTLPKPSARQWPFPERFPRTSGTGRLGRGASFWSDWLFDDHGATAPTGSPVSPTALNSSLAPTQGVASYPPGPAKNNGADIFRTAVGLTSKASYWRVDWTTLVNKTVPIAEWTFDTDNNAKTGTSNWPAAAGVHSAGIDKALVVSAKGAELISTKTGKTINVAAHGGAVTVNRKVRSFIVRIPRRLLPVSGRWRIRTTARVSTSPRASSGRCRASTT
jgi:hypothetical protein